MALPLKLGPAAHEQGDSELEQLERELLLEALRRRWGYDFRDYAPASLQRRIRLCVQEEGLDSISGLQERVLHDPACRDRVLLALSVNFTSMFRDPHFYLAFRQRVVPVLRTYPFVRIWHAGCSTGEEVYSMAILLREEGLYDRCRIYATDRSEAALQRAEAGIFPLAAMRQNTANYMHAGSSASFTDYYTAKYGNAIFSASLRKNVVFGRHDLAVEPSFNEFNVILCRNVLIYFNKKLQDRVHRLLYESLVLLGFLGLGNREMIQFTLLESCYEPAAGVERLYRKVR
jgi:chemotaxis protein methyltransferase CheR